MLKDISEPSELVVPLIANEVSNANVETRMLVARPGQKRAFLEPRGCVSMDSTLVLSQKLLVPARQERRGAGRSDRETVTPH